MRNKASWDDNGISSKGFTLHFHKLTWPFRIWHNPGGSGLFAVKTYEWMSSTGMNVKSPGQNFKKSTLESLIS